MPSNLDHAHQAPGADGVDKNHPAEQDHRFEIIDAERAIVKELPEPRKKIAICGFAASSRMLAPFDDPEYSIVTLNQLYRHVPRASIHFDIHKNFREANVEGTDHPAYLAECGIPVYMTQVEPSIPTSIRYPIERVIEKVAGIDYFTSTVAFMLGLAILNIDEQVERELNGSPVPERFSDARETVAAAYQQHSIGIYGIDLIVGTEYDFQKSCVEYMLGLANARGITIVLPPQCALLKQRWRYGYETEPANELIKMSELKRRGEALENERSQLIAKLQTIDGAKQEQQYWSEVLTLRLRGGVIRLNEDT